jgi:DNA-binding CsgD family transcriptional regulator/tetratricopeptide (TPR) repeat protein
VQKLWPLIGRQDELDLVVTDLAEGNTSAVIVGGAAGVGKTRLAMEAAAELASRGWSVERASATYSSSHLPFGALARLLAAPVSDAPAAAVETIRSTAASLAQRGRSSDGPLLLVVDDAHHLDEFSALLVNQLVVDGTVRVLGTLRSGEAVRESIVSIWKNGWGMRVDLLELSAEEVADLLRLVLGGDVDRSTSEALWRATSGHVLLLHEVVLDALDRGSLAMTSGVWRWRDRSAHGVRLREVVAARLGNLTPQERRAVELLALSEPLPVDVLLRLAPEVDVIELERRAVLRMESDGLRQNACLWHPILAEVVRGELSPPLRRAHASSLAAELRSAGARRRHDLLRLALLQLDAADTSRPEELAQAAMEANALPDHSTGERLAAAAYRVRPDVTSALALGEALALQGRHDEAEPILRTALELADDDVVIARVSFDLAQALVEADRCEEAAALLASARERIRDPAWRQVVEGHMIQNTLAEGRTRLAGEQGEALLARAIDGKVRLRLVSSLVPARALRGDTGEALAYAASVVPDAFAHQQELPLGVTWAFVARAVALLLGGQLREADTHVAMARAVSDGLVANDNFSVLALFEGRLALAAGRAADALPALRQSLAGLRRIRAYRYESWALALLAEAQALVGDRTGARATAARAVAEFVGGTYQGDTQRALAWVLVLGGERTTAIERLRTAADEVSAEAQHGIELQVRHDAYRLGDRTQAPALLDLAARTDSLWGATIAAHVTALEADDPVALDAASAGFEDQGALLFAAECAAEAALLYGRRGLKTKEAGARRRAEDLRVGCGVAVTPILAEVGDLVRLTRREREVVDLAAQGLTNAAIAERLFVGIRTVEGHLLRAFAKLGVSDRSQLGTALQHPD